jgi:riboflavin biosynthesis pyrimidine reductase
MLADDPLLTARRVYRERPLVRVLIDWHLKVSASARRVFDPSAGAGHNDGVACGEFEARRDAADRLKIAGAEFELFESRDLGGMLDRLAGRGVQSLSWKPAGIAPRVRRG